MDAQGTVLVADVKKTAAEGSALIIGFGIVTLVSAGAGAGFGHVMSKSMPAATGAQSVKSQPADTGHTAVTPTSSTGDGANAAHGAPKSAKAAPLVVGRATRLKELAPMTTNLHGPKAPWIRLEGSLLYDAAIESDISLMASKIAEDCVVYLRTVRLEHVQGSGGLQALVEDLSERARVRSGGKVQQLIISSFIIE
jgi:Flagellar basal body-associated protein FliL